MIEVVKGHDKNGLNYEGGMEGSVKMGKDGKGVDE